MAIFVYIFTFIYQHYKFNAKPQERHGVYATFCFDGDSTADNKNKVKFNNNNKKYEKYNECYEAEQLTLSNKKDDNKY